tara:strand:+ start:190 stop:423 length:234 start_codon:yes stop_codon:yes gene_type:complete
MSIHGNQKLTKEMRLTILEQFNILRQVTQRADEMHDLYLSDVDKLETVLHKLSVELGFTTQKDEDGHLQSWKDWVLK